MAAVDYLPHYRYEDYKEWEGDWELIYGVPYAMAPAPGITHQEINLNIGYLLKNALKESPHCRALPEVDWKIAEDTVVRPDTLVVCGLKQRGAYLSQTPELIFEILSPSTRRKDRGLKAELYAREGVTFYVIVDPVTGSAEIHRLDGQGTYRREADPGEGVYRFELSGCTFELPIGEFFTL